MQNTPCDRDMKYASGSGCCSASRMNLRSVSVLCSCCRSAEFELKQCSCCRQVRAFADSNRGCGSPIKCCLTRMTRTPYVRHRNYIHRNPSKHVHTHIDISLMQHMLCNRHTKCEYDIAYVHLCVVVWFSGRSNVPAVVELARLRTQLVAVVAR